MAFTKLDIKLTSDVSPATIYRGAPWIEMGYQTDITTATEAKAGVANTQHYITGYNIHYDPGTTGKYFNMQDDNGRLLTPRLNCSTYVPQYTYKFIRPLPCGVGRSIYLLAETAGDIGYIIEGYSIQERGRGGQEYGIPQASISASPSSTPSASISSSPSASLSVSASISASASSTPSVSASVSASPSSSPSVSASISSTASASISASPSWSG